MPGRVHPPTHSPAYARAQLGIVTRAQAEVMVSFSPVERPHKLDHRTARASGVGETVKLLQGLQALMV